MKKLSKNFIAFTLSEMMIVLLIISVISAATLPAITSRNESNASQISASSGGTVNVYSNWMYDTTYTRGYYYRKDSDYKFLIGSPWSLFADDSNNTQTGFNNNRNNNGRAVLEIPRTTNRGSRIKNRSDIILYDKNKLNVGRISMDDYKSIAIGKDAGYSAQSDYIENALIVGYRAGANFKSINTIIGAYAGYNGGLINSKNIVVGSHIKQHDNMNSSVVIGSYASADSYKNNNGYSSLYNYIGIGAYAGHGNPSTNMYGVSIGYYAGARGANKVNNTNYTPVNIGAYAGYDSSPTGHIPGPMRTDPYINFNSSAISVGYWAGSEQYEAKNTSSKPSGDGFGAVNIGFYAGNGSVRGGNINIGSHAGMDNAGYDNKNGDFQVNIGENAGANINGVSVKAINIGRDAGKNSTSPRSTNIGVGAGRNSIQEENINIGAYAGFSNRAKNSIFIGHYAGAYVQGEENIVISSAIDSQNKMKSFKGDRNVFVGCLKDLNQLFDDEFEHLDAGEFSYRYCIGGFMPNFNKKASSGKGIWTNRQGSNDYKYQMLFVPGGIKASSAIGFSKTSIILYARYVASPRATMYAFSDKRLKENIKPTKYGINKLRNVMVYQYNMIGNSEPCIGVVAQQLMKFYPHAVNKAPELVKKGGYLSVDTDWIIYSLAQSIKDVDKLVTELSENLSLEVKNLISLTQRVNNIEVKLDRIAKSNQETKKQLKEMESITKKWSSK